MIRLDEHAKEVTVKGGTTLNEVNDILEERGYALSILPSISHQTVAGAISTGKQLNYSFIIEVLTISIVHSMKPI